MDTEAIPTTATVVDHEPSPAPPATEQAEGSIDLEPSTPIGTALPSHVDAVPMRAELADLAALAVTFAGAQLVPAPLRNKPNDVLVVLLTARELGVGPMAALREFHVIEGKVTISPKMRAAMIRRAKLGDVWPDEANDRLSATWYAVRAGEDKVHASTFTLDDATDAELLDSRCDLANRRHHGKGPRVKASDGGCRCKDNWVKFPARMLSWRAAGFLFDDLFGEVGTGLYSPDELGAITDEDGQPIDATGWETPPGIQRPAAARARGTSADGRPVTAGDPDYVDPDEVARIVARIATIDDDDLRAELKSWWKAQELPPVDHLPQRKAKLVDARLTALGALTTDQLAELATMAAAGQPEPEPEPEPEPGAAPWVPSCASCMAAQNDGADSATYRTCGHHEPEPKPAGELTPSPAQAAPPAPQEPAEPSPAPDGPVCVSCLAPATTSDPAGDPYCSACGPF